MNGLQFITILALLFTIIYQLRVIKCLLKPKKAARFDVKFSEPRTKKP